MKIYIVVTDVVNDVTYSRKSINMVITLLLHGVIHLKTATSYDNSLSLESIEIDRVISEPCNNAFTYYR